jgi:transcriptional regulator GlxA family with amidase domain
MPATRNVAVLLFPDVELLDFAGLFEVDSVASRWSDPPAFRVYTVAERPGPLVAKNGISINPPHLMADCPALMCW